jgi:hypothetical protein
MLGIFDHRNGNRITCREGSLESIIEQLIEMVAIRLFGEWSCLRFLLSHLGTSGLMGQAYRKEA